MILFLLQDMEQTLLEMTIGWSGEFFSCFLSSEKKIMIKNLFQQLLGNDVGRKRLCENAKERKDSTKHVQHRMLCNVDGSVIFFCDDEINTLNLKIFA